MIAYLFLCHLHHTAAPSGSQNKSKWKFKWIKIWMVWWDRVMLLLQPLRWCCIDCMLHHEQDVREEQKYMYVARTSNNRVIPMEWSWWVTSVNACEPGEQLIVLANGDDIEWSRRVIAIVACCHRAKLCAHAARDFQSQHCWSGVTPGAYVHVFLELVPEQQKFWF